VNGIEETGLLLLYGMDQFLKWATLRNRFWKVADSSTTTTTVRPCRRLGAPVHYEQTVRPCHPCLGFRVSAAAYTMSKLSGSKQSDPAAPWVHQYTTSKLSGPAPCLEFRVSPCSGFIRFRVSPGLGFLWVLIRVQGFSRFRVSPGAAECRVQWVHRLHRLHCLGFPPLGCTGTL